MCTTNHPERISGVTNGAAIRAQGRRQHDDQRQRQRDDAERPCAIHRIDQQVRGDDQQRERRLHFHPAQRHQMVRRHHQLHNRDQMEEEACHCRGQGHALPARLPVQHGREGRDAGNSVEDSRDSQPEQGHHAGKDLSVYRRAYE